MVDIDQDREVACVSQLREWNGCKLLVSLTKLPDQTVELIAIELNKVHIPKVIVAKLDTDFYLGIFIGSVIIFVEVVGAGRESREMLDDVRIFGFDLESIDSLWMKKPPMQDLVEDLQDITLTASVWADQDIDTAVVWTVKINWLEAVDVLDIRERHQVGDRDMD